MPESQTTSTIVALITLLPLLLYFSSNYKENYSISSASSNTILTGPMTDDLKPEPDRAAVPSSGNRPPPTAATRGCPCSQLVSREWRNGFLYSPVHNPLSLFS